MQMGIFNYDAWVTVNSSYTFNNPYLDPQSITLSMTGRDGGFWAGYYGPEVRNVSLSVNYSFDPCAADPLYSSSCPGYWEAWFAQFCLFWCPTSSEPEVEVASVDYTLTPSTTTSSLSMPEETTTGEVKVDAGGVEISTTGELSVPDGIPEEAKEKKPVDMNLIMSIVREATDDSKALSVVNQSIQDSLSEDSNPDFSGTNEALAAIRTQTEKSAELSVIQDNQQSSVELIESQQPTFSNVEAQIVEVPQVTVPVQEFAIDVTQQVQIIELPQVASINSMPENNSETEALNIIEKSFLL